VDIGFMAAAGGCWISGCRKLKAPWKLMTGGVVAGGATAFCAARAA